jgi:hypothetical protein
MRTLDFGSKQKEFMKTLTLIITLLSINSSALASELCMAQKGESVGYSSTMKYLVNCRNGKEFSSPKIITAFLLPIPYQWGKVARKKLNTMMSESGFVQDSSVQEREPVLIFNTEKTNNTYCTASESNHQQVGLDHKNDLFDFSIECNQHHNKAAFKGLTRAELGKYMRSLGVYFVFAAKTMGSLKDLTYLFEGK